ncbi:hypothetical protein [Winogradskyella wichelsiae]|uniref:hypothetical protein n=1 Tax=Winogradskyella wichelsiae TaxID=2697007 RepID=UPI0015CCD9CB|nr:hypothetical protein [Winogradskyella wichelsiae]
MKKIIYLFLLATLTLTFACEKNEVLTEERSAVSIDKEQYQSRQGNNNRGSGFLVVATVLNEVPPGTETLEIYFDMGSLETLYRSFPNNPLIEGPFNVFYRNQWLTSFTIYTIAYSSLNCDVSREKWTVNKSEYENFILLQPIEGVNSSVLKPRPVPKDIIEEEDEPIISVIDYSSCF